MSSASMVRADETLRAAQFGERWMLTAAAVGLAAIWPPLLALPDLDTEVVLRGVGTGLFVVMFALLAIDCWRPRPRGSTSVDADRGETHLQAARWHAWCLLIGAVAWVVLASSVLLADGLAESASPGRRGLALYVFVPLAPVVLAAAVVAVVHPLRVTLALSGASVRTAWRSRTVRWDDLADAAPGPAGNTARPVRIEPVHGRPMFAATRHLTVTPSAMASLVLHYRDAVADRSELGTVASQDRIDAQRDQAHTSRS